MPTQQGKRWRQSASPATGAAGPRVESWVTLCDRSDCGAKEPHWNLCQVGSGVGILPSPCQRESCPHKKLHCFPAEFSA